jgi:hypothetical protein
MQRRVSRRHFVVGASAGLGALGLGYFLKGRGTPERQTTTEPHTKELTPERAEKTRQLAALLLPYQRGAMVGDSRLENVSIDEFGMGVIMLESPVGRSFRVDICRREPANSTVQPIAQTKHCALFLRNSGSGDTPTDESMGLSVIALALAIQNNELEQPTLQLITKNEFWNGNKRSGEAS